MTLARGCGDSTCHPIASFNQTFNLACTFSPDLLAYFTVATGFRPGGGDALYPTQGAAWGSAFEQAGYTTKWPTTYALDRAVSPSLNSRPDTSMSGWKGGPDWIITPPDAPAASAAPGTNDSCRRVRLCVWSTL